MTSYSRLIVSRASQYTKKSNAFRLIRGTLVLKKKKFDVRLPNKKNYNNGRPWIEII